MTRINTNTLFSLLLSTLVLAGCPTPQPQESPQQETTKADAATPETTEKTPDQAMPETNTTPETPAETTPEITAKEDNTTENSPEQNPEPQLTTARVQQHNDWQQNATNPTTTCPTYSVIKTLPKQEHHSLAFSPDGKTLTSSDREQMCFRPDGKVFAVATNEGISIYDAVNKRQTLSIKVGVRATEHRGYLSFSPDGTHIALTVWADKVARLNVYDAANGMLRKQREIVGGRYDDIAYAPDGKSIAILEFDKLTIWHLDTDKATEYNTSVNTSGPPQQAGKRLAFSKDGRYLLVGARRLHLIDLSKNEIAYTKDLGNFSIAAVSFLPGDTHFIVSTSFKWGLSIGNVHVYSLTGKRIQTEEKGAASMTVHPTLPIFATATGDTTIQLWSCKQP